MSAAVLDAPAGADLLAKDDALLDRVERETFRYFSHEADAASGLVPDSTKTGSYASIAVVGLALSAYPVAAERGIFTREEAAARTLATLRFLSNAPQGRGADAAGAHGFFYHFLEMGTGRRAAFCELSTVDTAILVAGALAAAGYFRAEIRPEADIRRLADELYRRVEWRWAMRGAWMGHGWTPERGPLRNRWTGYSEALLLYVLALGSPTSPIPEESFAAFTSTYRWKEIYGIEHLYAGPLFIHQLAHLWIDFRGIRDAFMRGKGLDYFENSRRATLIQREYAIRNPRGFRGYGENAWGITASDGPGPAVREIDGVRRRFFDYRARGAPYGPDDGTLAPWGAIASLPFAPEVVVPAIESFETDHAPVKSAYGFLASINPTFRMPDGNCWIASTYLGLNEGPIVLAIENARSGLIWRLMRSSPYVTAGLRRAGFDGGWL
jgi:hypothetical protein